MKIGARDVDRFLSSPPESVRAVLIYGPDSGLVRERAHMIGRTIVPQLDDPFRVAELDGGQLSEDPARLGDEAAAISMTGGRRLVLVYGVTDSIAKVMEPFLSDPPGDAFIVVSAGDLAAKSKLRKLFESAKNAAAVPCYLDDDAALDRLVTDVLGRHDVAITPDARQMVISQLGSDRGLSRSELEKLALYAGPGGSLDPSDIEAAIGDSAASAIDQLVFAAASGQAHELDIALEHAFENATHAVQILRASANHLNRLAQTRTAVNAGKPAKQAMKSLRPPVFFKNESAFESQLRLWNDDGLEKGLSLLLKAEADCKKTGLPDRLVCARVLQQIAAIARRGRSAGNRPAFGRR